MCLVRSFYESQRQDDVNNEYRCIIEREQHLKRHKHIIETIKSIRKIDLESTWPESSSSARKKLDASNIAYNSDIVTQAELADLNNILHLPKSPPVEANPTPLDKDGVNRYGAVSSTPRDSPSTTIVSKGRYVRFKDLGTSTEEVSYPSVERLQEILVHLNIPSNIPNTGKERTASVKTLVEAIKNDFLCVANEERETALREQGYYDFTNKKNRIATRDNHIVVANIDKEVDRTKEMKSASSSCATPAKVKHNILDLFKDDRRHGTKLATEASDTNYLTPLLTRKLQRISFETEATYGPFEVDRPWDGSSPSARANPDDNDRDSNSPTNLGGLDDCDAASEVALTTPQAQGLDQKVVDTKEPVSIQSTPLGPLTHEEQKKRKENARKRANAKKKKAAAKSKSSTEAESPSSNHPQIPISLAPLAKDDAPPPPPPPTYHYPVLGTDTFFSVHGIEEASHPPSRMITVSAFFGAQQLCLGEGIPILNQWNNLLALLEWHRKRELRETQQKLKRSEEELKELEMNQFFLQKQEQWLQEGGEAERAKKLAELEGKVCDKFLKHTTRNGIVVPDMTEFSDSFLQFLVRDLREESEREKELKEMQEGVEKLKTKEGVHEDKVGGHDKKEAHEKTETSPQTENIKADKKTEGQKTKEEKLKTDQTTVADLLHKLKSKNPLRCWECRRDCRVALRKYYWPDVKQEVESGEGKKSEHNGH